MNELRLKLNGVAHHIDIGGDERAPAVVFLHYFGGSGRSWAEVVGGLGSQVRCVAPDLRGFGETAAPETGYAVDDYADDLAALIVALELREYILVGHSMGGKIALAHAARRPIGLRFLLLLAPSPSTPEPMAADERARLLTTHGDRAAAVETISSITHLPLPAPLLEQAVADNLRSSSAAWRAWLEQGSREDIADRMGNVDAPVSVLVGRNDPVMPRPVLQRDVADRVGGTLTVASDAGHLLPLESPETVIDALRPHLYERNPQPGGQGAAQYRPYRLQDA